MESLDKADTVSLKKRKGHGGENGVVEQECRSNCGTKSVLENQTQRFKRLSIPKESNRASQLWAEVRSLIDLVSVQNSCLLSKCAELTVQESKMLTDKENDTINEYHKICNILNHRGKEDKGHNLLSHQIIQYVYDNNLVFISLTALVRCVRSRELIDNWKRMKHNQREYVKKRYEYSELFKVSRAKSIVCRESCNKSGMECNNCRKTVTLFRLETIWHALLTALNRILPDDHNYADNIVKSILNLDSLSTCNALLSLSGYKPFGRTKYHEYLRDIDSPPVPFAQLVTNIEILLKRAKQRGTGVKASYCLFWMDNYTQTNNDDLSS
jgi:hypothetical protein